MTRRYTNYLQEKLDSCKNLLPAIANGDEDALEAFDHYLGAMSKEINRFRNKELFTVVAKLQYDEATDSLTPDAHLESDYEDRFW